MENGGRDKNGKTFREYCYSWSGVKNTLLKAEKAVLGKVERVEHNYKILIILIAIPSTIISKK